MKNVCSENEQTGLYCCSVQAEFSFDLLQLNTAHVHEMTLTHESRHE